MGIAAANVEKLRRLMKDEWRIESLQMQYLGSSWRSTVELKRGKKTLTLQSEDHDFSDFCHRIKQFCGTDGTPMFKQVADLNRYWSEVQHFATDFEPKKEEAFERLAAGKIRLPFVPQVLISEFLKSRDWSNRKYLPLKEQYFDVFAVLAYLCRDAAQEETKLLNVFPEAKPYEIRIGEVLRKRFDPFTKALQNYLCFVDTPRKSLHEMTEKLMEENRLSKEAYSTLAGKSPMDGHVGFPPIIDIYRRYAEWSSAFLKTLCETVCMIDGRPSPGPTSGMSKCVEVIGKSSYADIVDCFDPRIRHAASHVGISYDQARHVIKFDGADSDGVKRFDNFELTYVEAAEKTMKFIRGFIPGLLCAFGMQQELMLFTTIHSGDYIRLLLLIDNEAPI